MQQVAHYARTCGAKDTLAVLILATKRVLALGSTTVEVTVATLEIIWGYKRIPLHEDDRPEKKGRSWAGHITTEALSEKMLSRAREA